MNEIVVFKGLDTILFCAVISGATGGLVTAFFRIVEDCKTLRVIHNVFFTIGLIASVNAIVVGEERNTQMLGGLFFFFNLIYLLLFNNCGEKEDKSKSNKHSKRTYKF